MAILDCEKPIGTGALCLNSESDAIGSMRKRLVPAKMHCLSGLSGQVTSFKVGTRTKLTRGCQSPASPSQSTGRNRIGQNKELPNPFREPYPDNKDAEPC